MELGKIYKKTNETTYTLGAALTYELLLHQPQAAVHLYFHPDFTKSDKKQEFIDLCLKYHISYSENEKIFRRLSEKDKCLVIGEFKKYEPSFDLRANHLVLVNPSDMGNLGTIIRTAIGFNYHNLAIIRPACDIFNPKAIRATMGAIFQMNFRYYDSFEEYQKEITERTLYCFRLNAATSLTEIKKDPNHSLIFGNESSGLPKEFDEIGTGVLIKMNSSIDSLSLPVAVSIGCYEFQRSNF